jgi:CBS domain containing-hemolysin-like protein
MTVGGPIEPALSLSTGVVLLVVGVLTQGIFAGTEIALMGADRLVLRARAEEGDPAAQRVLSLLERPSRLVSTCLVGVSLGSVFAATVFTDIAAHFTTNPTLAAAIAFPPIAIIFCELIPKALFHQYATVLAPRLIVPLVTLSTVLRPLLWATEAVTRGASRAFGVKEGDGHGGVRREDIQLLLDTSPSADIQAEEREMILRVFNFSETLVQDAMVPLIDVVSVAESATVSEAAAIAAEHGFSRLPVYRRRVDRMVGVVTHSDLLFAPDPNAPVGAVMHEVVFAPETKRVDQLFLDLRRRRQRLAIAVDEYGGGVGVISIEDILEELVGDIEDEFDRRRPVIRRSGEREWVASARLESEALQAATGFELPEGDYETVAGFVLARLGHVPAVGERVTHAGWTFEVSKANERAVLELIVRGPADKKAQVGR